MEVAPLPEPVPGRAYRIRSRNLGVVACVAPWELVGIREKLGSRYLSTEYVGGRGSVRAILEDLGAIPPGIPLSAHTPPRCSACGAATVFTVTESDGRGEHSHADGTPLEEGASSVVGTNRELFAFLEALEAAASG